MAYDPQRNRVRAQPAADEPAPVDLVLGGPVEPEATAPVAAAVLPEPAAVHDHVHDHEHGPDCDHEHGPDLRLIVAAGLTTLAAAALVLRRRRSARR